MDERLIKEIVENLEKLEEIKEDMERMRDRLEEDIKEIKSLEQKLFSKVVNFIENLLEGKEIGNQKIHFIQPGNLYSYESRWVYGFELEDNELEVTIAENIKDEMGYKTLVYNLETKEIRFKGEVK